jgi:hypothetical protein
MNAFGDDGSSPEAVDCPVFLRSTSIHLLIPELSEQQPPARIDEATWISCHWSTVVTAQRAVERARRGAAERGVGNQVGGSQGRKRKRELREEAAGRAENAA